MPPYPHMPGFAVPAPLTNVNAGAILLGQPVYPSAAGSCNLALANALTTSVVIGVVAVASVATTGPTPIQDDGVVTQPTASWDAFCGTTGGLAVGTTYYLSPTVAGQLTSTAPTARGQCVVPVLIGISSTQAIVQIQQPVLL